MLYGRTADVIAARQAGVREATDPAARWGWAGPVR